jgi:predicted Zn-dependent protease
MRGRPSILRKHAARLAAVGLAFGLLAKPAAAQIFSSLTTRDEMELGRQTAIEVERRYPVLHGYTERRVQTLGQRLASRSGRSIPYHFKVLDLGDANAFALPGGYVYVHRGALELAQGDSEVAGILAHEIAHVARRHSVEQLRRAQSWGLGLGILDMLLGGRGTAASIANLGAQMVGQGVFLKHSRDAEREADREGVRIMLRAGLDPRGMLTFMHRLADVQRSNPSRVDTFFSTHPSLQERERNIRGLIGTRSAAGAPPRTAPRSARRSASSSRSRHETAVDARGRVIRFRRDDR